MSRPSFRLASVLSGLLLCWPAAAAAGAELEGRIVLARGTSGKTAREVRTAQIYFTPDTPVAVTPPAEPFEIVTVRKEFLPRALTVPVGSRVRFPNQDVILHNVFSVSGKNKFDLGLYRRSDGEETTFQHPGLVRVFCNVHHSMVAYVLVTETPFSTTPEVDGNFRLTGLPAGPGTLTVWHERSKPHRQQISIPASGPLEVRLEVSKPRVPRHSNKFGKPYARKRSGRAYR